MSVIKQQAEKEVEKESYHDGRPASSRSEFRSDRKSFRARPRPTHVAVEDKDPKFKPRGQRKSPVVCKYFSSEHGCRNGDKCTFKHPVSIKNPRERKDEYKERSSSSKESLEAIAARGANAQGLEGSLTNVADNKASSYPCDDTQHGTNGSLSLADLNNSAEENGKNEKSTSNEATSHSLPVRALNHTVCKYFMSKQGCIHGRNCRFRHVYSRSVKKSFKNQHDARTKSDKVAVKDLISDQSVKGMNCDTGQIKVDTGQEVLVLQLTSDRSDCKDDTIRNKQLRETELKQLERRFAGQEKSILVHKGPPTIYRVNLSPTDPDWPFIIQEIAIEVTFPEVYPVEMFTIEVKESEQFPVGFPRYMSEYISDWIRKRSLDRTSSDLAFRPFLKWFDRNMEELFTKAAQQVKRDMEARAAGLQFIPHENLQQALSQSNTEIPNEGKETPCDDQECQVRPCTENISEGNKTKDSDKLDNIPEIITETWEADFTKVALITSQINCNKTTSGALHNNSVNNDKITIIKLPDNFQDTEKDTVAIEDILEVCRRPSNNANDETSKKDEGAEADVVSSVKNGGTEIKFRYLDLSESVASLSICYIVVTVECRRCHTRSDMKAHPNKTVSLVCEKCRNLQSLTYKPEIVHHFSTLMGYLFLEGCRAFDLLLLDCVLTINCLNCSKDSQIKGIGYGQKRDHWCSHCHQKMDIKIEGVRFRDPHLDNDNAKLTTVPGKKKPSKDPGIREGQPLPDNGTCKHYKKSYRWLRFPCCGKCYPCDVCHEEKEDHEMKFASRMVCGFCSKEQPFNMERPCISCNANMKKVRTSHWEGGRGCRDKSKMSKDDKRKFAGVGKTVSRKQESSKPGKAKKK